MTAGTLRAGLHFLRRCEKPDRLQFRTLTTRVGAGMLGVGLLGFAVRLVFVPVQALLLA